MSLCSLKLYTTEEEKKGIKRRVKVVIFIRFNCEHFYTSIPRNTLYHEGIPKFYRPQNMEFTEFAFSMPTCYQLGIPNEPSPSEIQGAPYPFPPQMVPIPHPLYDCNLEPAFIRKRNERERIRVRHVNEGYARLREHLPNEPTEKRMSKVETLRAAIRYIRRLEMLLERTKDQSTCVSDKNSIGQTK